MVIMIKFFRIVLFVLAYLMPLNVKCNTFAIFSSIFKPLKSLVGWLWIKPYGENSLFQKRNSSSCPAYENKMDVENSAPYASDETPSVISPFQNSLISSIKICGKAFQQPLYSLWKPLRNNYIAVTPAHHKSLLGSIKELNQETREEISLIRRASDAQKKLLIDDLHKELNLLKNDFQKKEDEEKAYRCEIEQKMTLLQLLIGDHSEVLEELKTFNVVEEFEKYNKATQGLKIKLEKIARTGILLQSLLLKGIHSNKAKRPSGLFNKQFSIGYKYEN